MRAQHERAQRKAHLSSAMTKVLSSQMHDGLWWLDTTLPTMHAKQLHVHEISDILQTVFCYNMAATYERGNAKAQSVEWPCFSINPAAIWTCTRMASGSRR